MLRLLVIEDFPPLAKSLLRTLRRAGYAVQMAASRAEARHVGGPFDVAIVDLELPDGRGTEVAQDLRSAGCVERFVFFTACHDSVLLTEAASLGVIVDKAAGLELLLAALRAPAADGPELRMAVGDRLSSVPAERRTRSQRSGTRRIPR